MTPLVLVTRPAGEADPLVARLSALGYAVAAVPTVALEPVAPGGPLDRALLDLGPGDWVVVTSPTGAIAVGAAMARQAIDPRSVRWAAIGPTTGAAVRDAGAEPSLTPVRPDPDTLVAALASSERIRGCRVVVARSDRADPAVPSALAAAGADVVTVDAYRTIEGPARSRVPLAAAFSDPRLAAIVLASGSAARGALALVAPEDAERLRAIPVVSIGPSTTRAIEALGLVVAVEAAEPSVAGLADAVARVVPPPVSPPARTLTESHA